MEDNLSEALMMAGAVLLFIIGLSVCMFAFSSARVTMDTVISYSDREASTIEGDSRYYYLSSDEDTSRYVGVETIIPAIYRVYKENFKIVFEFPDTYYLFEKKEKNKNTGAFEINKVTTIDLTKQEIANDLASRQFLNGIVYGKYAEDIPGSSSDPKLKYQDYFKIVPHETPLYDKLKTLERTWKIKESLGTYYIEDLTQSNISDANKTEKRVITYTFEP